MITQAAQIAPAMISWLDLFGIAVFAASGALAAAQRKQTLVTFSFFAPVFWVQAWRFAATCLVTAGLVWVTPQHLWKPRALDWFDAVGIAIYAVFGTWKSLTLGVPLLPAMMMGVITACVGGIIRDVLAGEPSILLKPEIYVTAAALASGLFGLSLFIGIPVLPAAIFSATAGFALRAMAIWKGWAIPAYRG